MPIRVLVVDDSAFMRRVDRRSHRRRARHGGGRPGDQRPGRAAQGGADAAGRRHARRRDARDGWPDGAAPPDGALPATGDHAVESDPGGRGDHDSRADHRRGGLRGQAVRLDLARLPSRPRGTASRRSAPPRKRAHPRARLAALGGHARRAPSLRRRRADRRHAAAAPFDRWWSSARRPAVRAHSHGRARPGRRRTHRATSSSSTCPPASRVRWPSGWTRQPACTSARPSTGDRWPRVRSWSRPATTTCSCPPAGRRSSSRARASTACGHRST